MGILDVKNVSYEYRNKYRTVKAVNGIDYSFDAGKFYAIVGASGCGKTTFLSLLAGLDVPSGGDVIYASGSTKSIDRDDLRRDDVAVIYQSFNLFPLLTVLENVMYPLSLHKTPKKEARQIAKEKLAAVGLTPEFHKRFPSMLSGGEQQRVAIARSLAAGGSVILADEPTGNLDAENSRNIIDILKRLAHDENYCVIVVTHDSAVASCADEVIKLRDGKIE
ncbi:MAG: ABC transporter ATP-binding protein [Eubacteriales bacterium]|jgi:ABC-type lipoprotein export system ATPase subunit|nr:ABC transporter ATP-binding protein [Eubacteriales bacterium]MCI6028563.1 ABC transporter ATP-binding protein [Clostridiales bacterium]MDD7414852.1 ABC transporter ATP-binding protein [Clostridiales bacterium]MDY5732614.1 ABC transporter ATP-binding protein [Eubacteriales bacterium]